MAVEKSKTGEYAFLGGLGLAVLLCIITVFISLPASVMPILFGVLALLGLIVGLMNVTEKEITPFLVAAIALLAVPSGLQPIAGILVGLPGGLMMTQALLGFLGALGSFIAPAAFVNAVRAIYYLAKAE